MVAGKKKKILVIDDSMTNLVLLNGILNEEGFDVESSMDAKQGLHLLSDHKPDLVLLDLKMPIVSGFDFLKLMYSDDKNKNIPVIAVTAYNEDKFINNSYNLGVVDVVLKPIEINQLVDKINNAINA